MKRYWNIVLVLSFIGINAALLRGAAQYYATDPVKLLFVAAIVVASAWGSILCRRLSPPQRYQLKLLLWGIMTVCAVSSLILSFTLSIRMFLLNPSPNLVLSFEVVAPFVGWVALMGGFALFTVREFLYVARRRGSG